MSPRHFTQDDREKLEVFLKAEHSRKEIGQLLGFHPSSISREIKRNSTRGVYMAPKAHERAQKRRKEIERESKWDNLALRQYIFDRTLEGSSPQQIRGRLPIDFPDDPTMRIAHEWIYWTAYNDPRIG